MQIKSIIKIVLLQLVVIFNVKSECNSCDYKYEPVCASDGLTYGSLCEFNCLHRGSKNITVLSSGECSSACIKKRKRGLWSPTAIAHLKYNYYDCMENERCLKVVHASRSTVNCFSIEPDAPVCGPNGTVYENSCIFYCLSKKKNLTAIHRGVCSSEDNNIIQSNGVQIGSNYLPPLNVLCIIIIYLWIILGDL